jgi:hypothetical protein
MKNKIETTDIYLTAALLALGSKLESVDKSDPRHMKFVVISKEFESENLPKAPNGDLGLYENEWANGTLLINAVAFKDAIQRMKSVIHSK